MLNRTLQPDINLPGVFKVTEPESITLENGLTLHVINSGEELVNKIEFVFPSDISNRDEYPIASAAHQLLDSGIPGMNALDIANEFDFYGAYFQSELNADYKNLSLFSLSKFLPDTLPLLLKLIQQAEYPHLEIENYIVRNIQNLRVNQEKVR